MSAKFVPQAGMYFYVAVRPVKHDVEDAFGNVTTVVRKDGSYRGSVFYCMATDDSYIVADRVMGGYASKEPYLFSLTDYDFDPIGPDVMRAVSPYLEHKLSQPTAQESGND